MTRSFSGFQSVMEIRSRAYLGGLGYEIKRAAHDAFENIGEWSLGWVGDQLDGSLEHVRQIPAVELQNLLVGCNALTKNQASQGNGPGRAVECYTVARCTTGSAEIAPAGGR